MRMLKLRKEMTVAELCRSLKLTHTAVRRHIARLEKQGLLSMRIEHQAIGRPLHKYCLTPEAAAYFPSGYEQMLETVLDTVFASGGHKAVMDLLRANSERIFLQHKTQFENRPLPERVVLLCDYFCANGYMTSFKPLNNGQFFVYHQNCAIYTIAVKYRQCCILEPRLMEGLLGTKVTRQQYILKGKPICGYLITP